MDYQSIQVYFGIFVMVMFIIGMGCCVMAGYVAHKNRKDGKK